MPFRIERQTFKKMKNQRGTERIQTRIKESNMERMENREISNTDMFLENTKLRPTKCIQMETSGFVSNCPERWLSVWCPFINPKKGFPKTNATPKTHPSSQTNIRPTKRIQWDGSGHRANGRKSPSEVLRLQARQQMGTSISRREPTRVASTSSAKGITMMSYQNQQRLCVLVSFWRKIDGFPW